ncbi:MAG: site-specific DNA-methyltransferase [Gemmatimonadetes bacterium]|nr:site-specific DNA-methyltransferase [Acidobacteriota bacterium]MYE68903.1 site-specific DNA-methyltransferase [Gemmatimonadota bacterium]MYJ68029.1 site-specific DNA-methyltransferase [Gemmatimonadota bacterium]
MSARASREPVGALQHRAKRKNLPPAGLESHGQVGSEAPHRYEFNPHLPPALRSSPEASDADLLPNIVRAARNRSLNEDEAQILAEALRRHEPWLEWAGKRERPWFEVDPVALHMHERVSTEALLRAVRRKDVQRSLFGDPELDYAKAVQFYRHDIDWTNRLILGDSLQVMASLARREDLASKVQMIYLDPPYGISFRSNFQPDLGRRDVKDRAQDLTREPEMVRAYRDTWTLGVHSYLAYLRDRLAMAHELLAATGSIFVQISDENVHRVRCVMDEVFGKDNAVVTIIFKKKGATVPTASVHDYLLWYVKDAERKKVIPLATGRGDAAADPKFRTLMAPSGETIPAARLASEELARLLGNGWQWCRVDYPIVSQDPDPSRSRDYRFQGQPRKCGANKHWRFDVPAGLDRLARAERLFSGTGSSVGGVVFWEDSGRSAISNLWTDTKGEESPVYSVQTARKVVERCLLMTTDPGDLVLDPTCGSGTTPFVAEKWGRRWIAIDTSRVALTLAKHRLMTATFDNYRLRKPHAQDLQRNPDGPWLSGQDHAGRATGEPATLDLKTVPRVTLKSIARNVSLDPIFEKHEPVLASALKDLNAATVPIEGDTRATLVGKLVAKHRERGARSVTDADLRRWLLPGTSLAAVRPERARGPL